MPAENVTGHATGDTGVTKPVVTANVTSVTPNVTLNERQRWVISTLSKSARIRRADVEKQFTVGTRTVKRDLKGLIQMRLIEFVRQPKPGYYRLAER
jgi:predicted ArsR family transcriptional regulator